jgi:hypothetical protein
MINNKLQKIHKKIMSIKSLTQYSNNNNNTNKYLAILRDSIVASATSDIY